MGSKQKTKQQSTENVDKTQYDTVTGIAPYQQMFNQQYGTLQGGFNNLMKTPLGLEFAPAFSSSPDAIVQNLVSQGIQGIRAQQAAGDRNIASSLSRAGTGDNSSLLSVLQRQSQIANAGAANALVPQALQQQRDFDIARQNIIAQQNQTKLAGRGQQLQELMGSGNLLNAINAMAQTSAGRNSRTVGTSKTDTNTQTKRSFI